MFNCSSHLNVLTAAKSTLTLLAGRENSREWTQIDEDEELWTHFQSCNAAETWVHQPARMDGPGKCWRCGEASPDTVWPPEAEISACESESLINIVCASCWLRANASTETLAAARPFPTRTSRSSARGRPCPSRLLASCQGKDLFVNDSKWKVSGLSVAHHIHSYLS